MSNVEQKLQATSLTGDPLDVDFDNIPGVDPDAVAEGGVDAEKDDAGGCEGGACKI